MRKSLRWKRRTMPFSFDFDGLRTRLPLASISTHRRFQRRVSGNWMLRSPTCTGGGGSRSEARDVMRLSCSACVRLLLEFFHGMDEIDEDMRLNILLVRDDFLSFLSSRLSSPSWLWIDFDSLMRRPNGLHALSDDVREGPVLCSRECDVEGALGDVGSVRPRVGLGGVHLGFWWSMIRGLW